MKKFNVNSILFVFAAIFIVVGIQGEFLTYLKWGTIDMLAAFKHLNIEGVMDAKASIDRTSSEKLWYHDTMMDIDSLKNNLLGTRIVFKDDTTVVKANSGSLIEVAGKKDNKDLEASVKRIKELENIAEASGAEFLYCAAPTKESYEIAPANVDNYAKENYEAYLKLMTEGQIPLLDFTDVISSNEAADTEKYYYTDHHWTVQTGFFATKAICDELSNLYGFTYNDTYTDIQNYTIQHYSDWFLGSYGKKVGKYFTWCGADDFDLITPNFETDLIEERPLENIERKGSFEETVLFMEHMIKDYYHKNPYGTYSGGDHRLQIMKNNLSTNGKKILLIRDSFACVVAPFLSLQADELHICDMRDFIPEEKMNMADYINEIKPDYVIVLFEGIKGPQPGGSLDFF